MGADIAKVKEDQLAEEGIGREKELYSGRFSSDEQEIREVTWKVLTKDFFQKYIDADETVVDIGAGDGHFITNINCARKIAVDISPHVNELTKCGVEVCQTSALDFATKIGCQADVVFMSNFLEHLPDKRVLLEVLDECHRALKQGGRMIILQPNVRYVGSAYWDYIDHNIALTERSLVEALNVSGFDKLELIPRFLPYTTKSMLGSIMKGSGRAWLVRLYLKVPLFWRILGQQTLVVARKR